MPSAHDNALLGRFEVLRPAPDRQLAMDAFAAIRGGHPMVALLELDVTEALAALEALRAQGQRASLFAFVVRAIAVATSEHRDLNLVRHGTRLVRFEDVDVNVPVEVHTPEGDFPRQVVIRSAQNKSVTDIYGELAAARSRYAQSGELGAEDRWVHRIMHVTLWLPRFVRVWLTRMLMRNAFRIKARAGTTLVTSVGKYASIPGFSFSFSTGPRAAVFAVGSAVEKPWVHARQLTTRSVLSLSIMVDHDLVDGAPAARFATRLQALIESADGLPASPRR